MRRNWWDELAIAIVRQAANDYLALGKGPIYCDLSGARINDVEIEQFFRSEWFVHLTSVDGSYIFRKLKEERERECNTRTDNHQQPD